MSLNDIVKEVYDYVADGLDTALGSVGLAPLENYYFDQRPREEKEHGVGVLICDPSGTDFHANVNEETITVTVECLLSIGEPENMLPYADAILNYLKDRSYGYRSQITEGQINRTDLGDTANRVVFAIEIVTDIRFDAN